MAFSNYLSLTFRELFRKILPLDPELYSPDREPFKKITFIWSNPLKLKSYYLKN